ncbi:succinate dehydrogenase assembly factor 2 [Larsenimonas rhizosphaerae]|uniref:FAD assembly factor SdhE n=1 Tax=Larsenimonas rhizosphaerae TaxID=2944682 RepID=A0AA41ZFH7_9GAMM|nr:succinate dehydrogenase assembly factor 2 [Larsenimonas rhizosphaerae]MCM2130896.1 succinate dehydrogenase assembly factor 2 [Larsenimonas rhizosphaerae]MCX2523600.1 succinate dehydrogenase assembly factor 2 [Larsenimonas rhizosphaerae]
MEEAQRKRLYWHSRRGMWELDLMLVPFLERRFDALSDDDQQLYVTLLAEEDQDLFMWLMRREVPSDPELHRMVNMVINDAETANTRDVRPI